MGHRTGLRAEGTAPFKVSCPNPAHTLSPSAQVRRVVVGLDGEEAERQSTLTLSLSVLVHKSKFFFLRVMVSLWSSVVIERL